MAIKHKAPKKEEKKHERDQTEVSSGSDPLIILKNVHKKYRDGTNALEDIDIEIEPGEFVFLIGASGAGKTTLMNMLVREDLPSSGQIMVDGMDVAKIKKGKVYNLRRKVGYIFQDYKLIEGKTVFENVAVPLLVAGVDTKKIKSLVPALLEVVGLEDKINKFPGSLSGGEKQRVAIARALAHEPKIILADEPTGNLDNTAGWFIVDILKKINNTGTTIIFGTHNAEVVDTLNKRVIELSKGRVIRDQKGGKYDK